MTKQEGVHQHGPGGASQATSTQAAAEVPGADSVEHPAAKAETSEEKVTERLERARAAAAAPMFGHDESVGVKIGLQEGEEVVRT